MHALAFVMTIVGKQVQLLMSALADGEEAYCMQSVHVSSEKLLLYLPVSHGLHGMPSVAVAA